MASKKYQKRLLNKFIQVFLTTFALLMIVIGIGTIMYVVVSQKNISNQADTSDFSSTLYPKDEVIDGKVVESAFGEKKMTTFAVFGVDEDLYRTDVNMIVFFNHETAKVDILSVPRDTQVKIPDEIYETIQSRRSDVSQIVKINEVPAYVIEDRNETSVAVLEKSLGVDIDYYINMNLDVFKFIVDEIGNITVDVPMDMVYNDPVQDLYINLKAGEQEINGAQAEQLIRYRAGYGTGDIGRIEMQHEFMKAFAKQLLTDKNRLNMVNILGGILVKVDTNFMNAVDYLIYLTEITPDSFEMHMLPGHADDSVRSYFIYDYEATKVILNDIINEPYAETINVETGEPQVVEELPVDVEPEVIIDVKSLSISVQNGTNSGGFAGGTKDKIVKAGYNAVEAIDYGEKPVNTTRILVPAEEVFEELKVFFDEPEMVLAPAMMDAEIQVIIILGLSDVPQ